MNRVWSSDRRQYTCSSPGLPRLLLLVSLMLSLMTIPLLVQESFLLARLLIFTFLFHDMYFLLCLRCKHCQHSPSLSFISCSDGGVDSESSLLHSPSQSGRNPTPPVCVSVTVAVSGSYTRQGGDLCGSQRGTDPPPLW